MHVCANQAGDNNATFQVRHLLVGVFLDKRLGLVNVRNESVPDQNGAIGDYVSGLINGNDGCMSVKHGGTTTMQRNDNGSNSKIPWLTDQTPPCMPIIFFPSLVVSLRQRISQHRLAANSDKARMKRRLELITVQHRPNQKAVAEICRFLLGF